MKNEEQKSMLDAGCSMLEDPNSEYNRRWTQINADAEISTRRAMLSAPMMQISRRCVFQDFSIFSGFFTPDLMKEDCRTPTPLILPSPIRGRGNPVVLSDRAKPQVCGGFASSNLQIVANQGLVQSVKVNQTKKRRSNFVPFPGQNRYKKGR